MAALIAEGVKKCEIMPQGTWTSWGVQGVFVTAIMQRSGSIGDITKFLLKSIAGMSLILLITAKWLQSWSLAPLTLRTYSRMLVSMPPTLPGVLLHKCIGCWPTSSSLTPITIFF